MMVSLSVEETPDVDKERRKYIPNNYKRPSMQIIETTPEIDPEDIFRERKEDMPVVIWRFYVHDRKFHVSRPISVKIYHDQGLFFAENESLIVCGTGDTSEGALKDLYSHIKHFFEYYKNLNRNRLMGDALRLKELYKDLLSEE